MRLVIVSTVSKFYTAALDAVTIVDAVCTGDV